MSSYVLDASALLRYVDRELGFDRMATISKLRALPVTIVAADADQAEQSGIFQHNFKVPYADAFAGSLAIGEEAALVTADFDFTGVARAIQIEFLPRKKGKTNQ